jgi:hypothetical protein
VTDIKSAPELVDKAFVYMTNLSRECRKAITAKFGAEYRGISFDKVEPSMRKEIESWFAERDRNITIKHERSSPGKPGELMMTYSGANKDAHFKFHVDGQFVITGAGADAASYIKNINVTVDKREFTR